VTLSAIGAALEGGSASAATLTGIGCPLDYITGLIVNATSSGITVNLSMNGVPFAVQVGSFFSGTDTVNFTSPNGLSPGSAYNLTIVSSPGASCYYVGAPDNSGTVPQSGSIYIDCTDF
jgi:hypothetical protein